MSEVGESHDNAKQTVNWWTVPDPAASFQALHSTDMIRPEAPPHSPVPEAESTADMGVLKAKLKTALDDLQD